MKSTNMVMGEEAVKSSKMEMDTQSGIFNKDEGKTASVDPTQVKRRWSETSELDNESSQKKCTIL